MEKPNWKDISASEGYKSLKAAVVQTIKRDNRFSSGKEEKTKTHLQFRKVIGRLQHLAYVKGVGIITLLDFHEKVRGDRIQSWNSYYSDFRLPKDGKPKNPIGINGIRNQAKKWSHRTPQEIKHSICERIKREQKHVSKKLKPRWTTKQKAFYKKHGFH